MPRATAGPGANVIQPILAGLERGQYGAEVALRRLHRVYDAQTGDHFASETVRNHDDAGDATCTLAQNEVLAPLNQLIGLSEVKKMMEEMYAHTVVQARRHSIGLRADHVVRHMVFTGRPGTGKTLVARTLGQVFARMGVLSRGHLIEVERADLVGEYVGQTAQKTRSLLQTAAGGVLFVDEAYSLARGGARDFGREAVDTLVKGMEDLRKDLIVILAGYESEMKDFIALNPGLQSRFPIHICFPDYCERELLEIARVMVQERDYALSPDGALAFKTAVRRARELASFGNGRTARNLIERAIRRHALRVAELATPNRSDLMELRACDFREGDGSDRVLGHWASERR